jgi:GNAT superfamily N-acetyltransferase
MQSYLKKAYTVEAIQANLNNHKIAYFIAYDDVQAVGYSKLLLHVEHPKLLGEVIELEKIYVRKNYLDKKVGKALMEHALNFAKSENYKNLSPGIYYTCVGDVGGLPNLGAVLRSADQIVYAPPPNGKWSDDDRGVSQLQQWTEDYLKIFSFRTSVKNFFLEEPNNKPGILELTDSRKSTEKQLWTVGCSISHGVGVELNQRYGHLLSEDLNLPVSFLTKGGSSVIWAADQILRSDIQCNDLIIWGITSSPRAPWFNNKVNHIVTNSYKQDPGLDRKFSFDYFTSEDITYRSVTSVFQVIVAEPVPGLPAEMEEMMGALPPPPFTQAEPVGVKVKLAEPLVQVIVFVSIPVRPGIFSSKKTRSK